MNKELQQKLEVIISPRLLLEKIPVSSYGVAFVAWGVYNSIGGQEVSEEVLRTEVEEFIQNHKFCIKLVDQLILFAQVRDQNSFKVFSLELGGHPSCLGILDQMFPGENNL